MVDHLMSLDKRKGKFVLAFVLSLIAGVLLSYSLINRAYFLLFAVLSVLFTLAVIKLRMLPLVLILLIIPFVDWAVGYSFLPVQIMWLPELMSVLFFAQALTYKMAEKQRFRTVGLRYALLLLAVTLLSLLFNKSGIVPALLFLRLLFRYYLLFLAILNLNFSEKLLRRINNVLIFIFLVQLPLAIVKLFIFGQGEASLSLNSSSLSMISALIAIAFLFSFYFLYKKKIVYLLGIFAFVGFSIIGGKRAFIFYLPILLAYLIWLIKKDTGLKPSFIFAAALFLVISFYFVARLIPTLNPQRKIWGDFNLKHIMDYAISYETSVSLTGMPTGRISSTMEIYNSLKRRGLLGFSLGYGPGIIIKTMFSDYDRRDAIRDRFGVEYGINGMNWLGIQVGYLGTVIYMLIFYVVLRKAYSYFLVEKDPYWHSFALGMAGFCFILIITSLFYDAFFNNDSVSAFYFYLAAVVVLKKEQHELSRT